MHGLMHISLGLSLLGALGDAAPAPQHHGQWTRVASRAPGTAGFVLARQANNTAPAPPATGNGSPSDTQLRNAVMSWMRDTGKVTNFMNTATSLTGDEYTRQATIALNAEVDELNHKKILDAGLGTKPEVAAANEILDTQGNFQNVVNVLQNMVNNGPDTAQADVDAINNNRCVNVLPNIDAYFAAAGMPEIKAVRPTGCLEVQNAPTDVPPAPVAPAPPPADNNAGNNTGNAGGNAGGNLPAGGNNNTGGNNNNAGGKAPTPTAPPNGARASSSPLPTGTSSSTTSSRPANGAAAKATSTSRSSSLPAAKAAKPTGDAN